MTEMREWWDEQLTEEERVAWITSLDDPQVPPDLVSTLPDDRAPGKLGGGWVRTSTTTVAGVQGEEFGVHMNTDFMKFLRAEEDKRRTE